MGSYVHSSPSIFNLSMTILEPKDKPSGLQSLAQHNSNKFEQLLINLLEILVYRERVICDATHVSPWLSTGR